MHKYSNLMATFARSAKRFRKSHRVTFNSLVVGGVAAAAVGVSAGAVALGLPFWAPGAVVGVLAFGILGGGGADG